MDDIESIRKWFSRMASSVDRLKAEEAAAPASLDVVGELLEVLERIDISTVLDGMVNVSFEALACIKRHARAVQQRRDELPEFDEKLARTVGGYNQAWGGIDDNRNRTML